MRSMLQEVGRGGRRCGRGRCRCGGCRCDRSWWGRCRSRYGRGRRGSGRWRRDSRAGGDDHGRGGGRRPPAPAAVVVTAGPAVARHRPLPRRSRPYRTGSGLTTSGRTGNRRTGTCRARTAALPDRPPAAHRPHPGPAWCGQCRGVARGSVGSCGHRGFDGHRLGRRAAVDDHGSDRPGHGGRDHDEPDHDRLGARWRRDRLLPARRQAAENDLSVTTPPTTPSPVPVPPALAPAPAPAPVEPAPAAPASADTPSADPAQVAPVDPTPAPAPAPAADQAPAEPAACPHGRPDTRIALGRRGRAGVRPLRWASACGRAGSP